MNRFENRIIPVSGRKLRLKSMNFAFIPRFIHSELSEVFLRHLEINSMLFLLGYGSSRVFAFVQILQKKKGI